MLNYLGDGKIIRAVLAHDVSGGELVVSPEGYIIGAAETDGVSGEVIAVYRSGVIYLPTTDIFDTDFQWVYVRAVDLVVVNSPLPTLTASDVSAAVQMGGSLSDGEYFYAITVTDVTGGETVIGGIGSDVVSGGDRSIQLSWPDVDGAVTYEIYRGIVPDELYHLKSVSPPTVAYLDDGTDPIGMSEPPDYNTTGTIPIGRYLAGLTGRIEVRSAVIDYPNGSRSFVETSVEQKWVPAGSIPLLLQLP